MDTGSKNFRKIIRFVFLGSVWDSNNAIWPTLPCHLFRCDSTRYVYGGRGGCEKVPTDSVVTAREQFQTVATGIATFSVANVSTGVVRGFALGANGSA